METIKYEDRNYVFIKEKWVQLKKNFELRENVIDELNKIIASCHGNGYLKSNICIL